MREKEVNFPGFFVGKCSGFTTTSVAFFVVLTARSEIMVAGEKDVYNTTITSLRF